MDTEKIIRESLTEILELRRKLNENAELSFKEYKTQNIILKFLKSLDIDAKTVANTGIEAVLNSPKDCIGVRADMDALPVNGVSHACGHDYHMAIVCGTALVLKKLGIKKGVKFIFQPGEEADGGAVPMIKEGVLQNPKVTKMLGFHVWPNVKVGTIEVCSGASMASIDDFYVTFKGRGGHAAMPNLCINPIYPATDFISTMNTKSRIQYNPLDTHIITFSSIQCGNTPNVISDECKVLGTVRTFSQNLRKTLQEDIITTSELCGKKYGCTSDVFYDIQYPPLISDESLTNEFIDITKKLIGDNKVLPLEKTFAGEDFAYFAEKIPSVHFRLGISDGDKGINPLHSQHFDASDEAIFYGIYILTNYIISSDLK